MSIYIVHTDKLHERQCFNDNGELVESWWMFWCPGCKEMHHFTVTTELSPHPRGWTFDGNHASPTFAPSLLYPSKAVRCHLFVQGGRINYCSDCGHNLAGAHGVAMEPLDVDSFESEQVIRK